MSFGNNDGNNTRNLFIMVSLFFLMSFGYDYFFSSKHQESETTSKTEIVENIENNEKNPLDTTENVSEEEQEKNSLVPISAALSKQTRVVLENQKLKGSIDLQGGIIDSITLKDYKKSTEKYSDNVDLFVPKNVENEYYYSITYSDKQNGEIIDHEAVWDNISSDDQKSVVLRTQTKSGLVIERTVSLDDGYIINVKDKLINISDKPIKLSNSADLVRRNPSLNNYAVVHEGIVGNLEGKIEEIKYDNIKSKTSVENCSWIGYTDIYWLCSIINPNNDSNKVSYSKISDNSYKCSLYSKTHINVNPNSELELNYAVFTGPKDISVLKRYEKELSLDKFDMAIDFGWFFILTKPLLHLMDFLASIFSNMGLVILILTLLFKIVTHPLMKKSFNSAARMREVQPKIASIQKSYAHDKVRMNQELMALYKKEKISPMSGCLPMLLQAPIFFCLYKVFFISIEMRHAPLFLWIKDLSAPDTLYIFNLFGAIDWDPPKMLQIGIWPIIMGLSMFLQQKISGAKNKSSSNTPKTPEVKMQENMMLILPVLFTYICASFPVGVVVYWTISNVFSVIQQHYVNKKVHLSRK